jgi:hypothetical protein
MRRLTHVIVLVAFILSCGGQWAFFQCIAWANMIREYSEMVPLAQAVQMTFSGQYPCPICKAIAEKKSSEQQKSLALDKYEKKFVLPLTFSRFHLNVFDVEFTEFSAVFSSRTETPPAPPPRSALS